MATATKKVGLHPLDALAQGDPKKVIALMLWKARRQRPDLYARIDEKDITGFDACVKYLKVKPDVMIKRPQGVPAQAAIPAVHGRRAVAARDAIPPRPYVVVALVEAGTENGIKPIENNEEDFDAAEEAAKVRRAQENAQGLADRLVAQSATGDYSASDVRDAAAALSAFARSELA